ncbi:MAG TPA: LD-carboxypeptidase [Longimicrobiaceae bacterium]|nr:LD-carboxypeptidase [Longimicrobiaceae bacterium]
MIRPPALGPDARIALVAPAGPLGEGAVDRAEARIRSWGWEPIVGRHSRGRTRYLSGSDEQRAGDMNDALRSGDNDAIWCLRGGYGTMRIVDSIDWDAIAARPRPLIGYSDNTALHLAMQRIGIVSFHGPHPAVDDLTNFSADQLRAQLTGSGPRGPLPFPPGEHATAITGGTAEGRLVGGNLSLVAATLGTPYAIQAAGAILFLEEVGEPAYSIDRMFTQLRLAGVLDEVAGIVLGAFTEQTDEGDPHIPSCLEVASDRLATLGVPVAYGFPFGHIDDSWTLPLGVRARLYADRGAVELLEAAVVSEL